MKHDKSWLNVDQSLNMDLFYEDGLHLIKEGSELLEKEIMIFYTQNYHSQFITHRPPPPSPHISYKNMTSFSYDTDDFPPLPSNEFTGQLTSVYIPVKPRERNSKVVSTF